MPQVRKEAVEAMEEEEEEEEGEEADDIILRAWRRHLRESYYQLLVLLLLVLLQLSPPLLLPSPSLVPHRDNLASSSSSSSLPSVWDTLKLLPPDSLPPPRVTQLDSTPMTGSFVHLHLGIDAQGLPPTLESHYTVVNTWDKIDDPQNMAIISFPVGR